MRIYVVTDIEGVGGIHRREQSHPGAAEYPAARELLTNEINALVEGALEGGAKEVYISDSHAGGGNVIWNKLHPAATMITPCGHGNWLPGFDSNFDAMFLLGNHAMAGTQDGILNHTFSSATILNFFINGEKYGEIGVAAMLAGHYKVPVVFCSGDLAAVREARELLGDIEGVVVKEGYSMYKGKLLTPAKSCELVRKGAKRALLKVGKIKPFILKPPFELKMEFMRSDYADENMDIEGNKRLDSRTIGRTVNSVFELLSIYH